MINYELAKALKDEGFVLREFDMILSPDDEGVFIWQTRYHYPTLSELIKACGNPSFKASMNNGRWFVIFPELEDEGGNQEEFWLNSLEEVFAILWLELKKKGK